MADLFLVLHIHNIYRCFFKFCLKNGKLICGILYEDTLRSKPGTLMHVIARTQSCSVVLRQHSDCCKQPPTLGGHSIGIGDIIANNFTYGEIQRAKYYGAVL